jgi:tetratricopeptide (TPR) repeat protein
MDDSWYLKGEKLKQQKKYEEAIVHYDGVRQSQPKNAFAALVQKSKLLFEFGYFEDTLESCNEILRISPTSSLAYQLKGDALFKLGRNSESVECFSKATQFDASTNSKNYHIALDYFKKGDYFRSIEFYDILLANNPKNFNALFGKANSLSKIGKLDEAIICYDEILKENPTYDKVLKNKHLLEIEIYSKSSIGKAKALALCDKSDEMIQLIDEIKKNGLVTRKALGEIVCLVITSLIKMGKYPEAKSLVTRKTFHWRHYLERELIDRGVSLQRLGKNDEAISCYNFLLKINTSNKSTVLINQARSFTKLGKNDEAIMCYDGILAIKPKYITAKFLKAKILFTLFRHEEALSLYDEIIEFYGENLRNSTNLQAHIYKANICYKMNQFNKAISIYEKILSRLPDNSKAILGKANTLIMLDRLEEALDLYDVLLDSDKLYFESLLGKSNVLSKLQRPKEAIMCYDKILDVNPQHSEALKRKLDIQKTERFSTK